MSNNAGEKLGPETTRHLVRDVGYANVEERKVYFEHVTVYQMQLMLQLTVEKKTWQLCKHRIKV